METVRIFLFSTQLGLTTNESFFHWKMAARMCCATRPKVVQNSKKHLTQHFRIHLFRLLSFFSPPSLSQTTPEEKGNSVRRPNQAPSLAKPKPKLGQAKQPRAWKVKLARRFLFTCARASSSLWGPEDKKHFQSRENAYFSQFPEKIIFIHVWSCNEKFPLE